MKIWRAINALIRGNGGPEDTNLEPFLEVLEEWAEQLKQADLQGLLEAEDKTSADSEVEPERGGPDMEGPQP